MSAATETSEPRAADGAPAAPSEKKRAGFPLPLVAVIVLVPVLCYVAMDFFVVPKLRSAVTAALAEGGAGSSAPAASGHAKPTGGGHGKAEAAPVVAHGPDGEHIHEFGPTIVNLGGGTSSRYLRVNLAVASKDGNIAEIVKQRQSALRDAAISVLSVQTLDGVDVDSARNTARNQLIDAFNRVLGSQVVSQIYFSEFVVQ